MAELSFARGRDTWASEEFPNAVHAGKKVPLLREASGRRSYIYVLVPTSGLADSTIVSATLSVPARTFFPAQTLTVRSMTKGWLSRNLSCNNRPTVGSTAVSTAIPATQDSERVYLDVTTLVQEFADGNRNLGFRITTNTDSVNTRVYGFTSGKDSWVLEVETSDAPDVPTGLEPDAGVVSVSNPQVSWVYDDAAVEDGDQTAFQVQIDPDADEVSPAFDTGEVASALPTFDTGDSTSGGTYAGLANGATTQWRVRAKNSAQWSDWSDWAEFSRVAKPTLTLVSPAGTTLADPSPLVQFTSSLPLVAYRVRVLSAKDTTKVLYTTFIVDADDATTIQVQVPFLNRRGFRPFARDDRDYVIEVGGLDRVDRAPTPGDPAFTFLSRTVRFDDDALPEITSLTARQVGREPLVTLRWTRAETADVWVVKRDGVIVARLDPDDLDDGVVIVAAGVWEWTDRDIAPNRESVYSVHAIVNGQRSPADTMQAAVYPIVDGVWVLPDEGEPLLLENASWSSSQDDRRTTHSPPGVSYDIDIITALGGHSGSVSGVFDPTSEGQEDDQAGWYAIKGDPATPVRLIRGNLSFPAILRDVSVSPDEVYNGATIQRQVVSFGFFQSDDFDVAI